MVSGVIGRGVVWSLLAVLGGCASATRVEVPPEVGARFKLLAVYAAVVKGDEAEYRQNVFLPPGDVYSDALTTTMFASIRLHQAIEQHASSDRGTAGGAGSATAGATSRASWRIASRPSSLAAVDYRQNAQAMMKAVEGWTFTVRGDRATIDQLAAQPGAPTLRWMNDRWMLVPTHWDTPRDTATYRLMVAMERQLASALATARAAVTDGTARSIEDVNEILRRELTRPEDYEPAEVRP